MLVCQASSEASITLNIIAKELKTVNFYDMMYVYCHDVVNTIGVLLTYMYLATI